MGINVLNVTKAVFTLWVLSLSRALAEHLGLGHMSPGAPLSSHMLSIPADPLLLMPPLSCPGVSGNSLGGPNEKWLVGLEPNMSAGEVTEGELGLCFQESSWSAPELGGRVTWWGLSKEAPFFKRGLRSLWTNLGGSLLDTSISAVHLSPMSHHSCIPHQSISTIVKESSEHDNKYYSQYYF